MTPWGSRTDLTTINRKVPITFHRRGSIRGICRREHITDFNGNFCSLPSENVTESEEHMDPDDSGNGVGKRNNGYPMLQKLLSMLLNLMHCERFNKFINGWNWELRKSLDQKIENKKEEEESKKEKKAWRRKKRERRIEMRHHPTRFWRWKLVSQAFWFIYQHHVWFQWNRVSSFFSGNFSFLNAIKWARKIVKIICAECVICSWHIMCIKYICMCFRNYLIKIYILYLIVFFVRKITYSRTNNKMKNQKLTQITRIFLAFAFFWLRNRKGKSLSLLHSSCSQMFLPQRDFRQTVP